MAPVGTDRQKPLRKVVNIIVLLIVTTLILFLLLVVAGNFSIATQSGEFGVYAPSHRGTGAYYNPLLDTLWFIENAALLLFPLVLFLCRRWVAVGSILPWVIISLLTILVNFYVPWSVIPGDGFDSTLLSTAPYFVKEQVITGVTIASGFLLAFIIRRLRLSRAG